LPIPVIAFSAIAQPSEAQIPAGIVAFATFVIGLAIIYRADRGEGEGVSMAYELKRAARTAPLMIVLIAVLVAVSQTGFLFPQPVYDPTQRAQLPKSVPLSGVKDRVLFSVQAQQAAQFTGPYRAGVLDVYDGENWRLPAFASSKLQPAPESGIIDELFGTPVQPKLRARIVVGGLEGTVLPLPARTKGIIVDRSPPLVVDTRTESVRVEQGQIEEGLGYDVVFAILPKEDDLRKAPAPNADIREEFLDTAGRKPPEAIRELLTEFETVVATKPELNNAWDRLDFLRTALKEAVTLTGQGLPTAVPPSKIQDMLAGKKEASPFEYVAAQALIARWAGVPSRIGYGFDKGEKKASSALLEYRPRHGASWLEVYFQGHGWIPVTGLPKRAKASTTEGPKSEGDILPSDEIVIELFIPLRETPANALFKQIQKALLLATPFAVTIGLIWLFWPAVYKARRKSKRRQWALQQGRAARIAVAYTEMRDMATDLGVGDPYATPLAYLRNVVPDEEHRQLAWLVTRSLWGDLRESIRDDDVFAAEELSRSVRRRLYEAQPFTIRFISLVSRLSLRNPYAPELLSPPLQKFELRRALARLTLRGRKQQKEKLDEIAETA
ncbi:MAG TPA: transglutaminase domain-containing protein, partial [Actinomycetota bacterium]|nr:transglutaminase domain-containing protein [Actinomycetota bacterium]